MSESEDRSPLARPFFYPTRTKLRDEVDALMLRVVGPVSMAFRCRVCLLTSDWRPTCFWGWVKCSLCDATHRMDWSRVGEA
jgi:hypothetical protein